MDVPGEVRAILSEWDSVTVREDGKGWLIAGLFYGRGFAKHTGIAPDGPDTPDDPIAAAHWLDAHARGLAGASIARRAGLAQDDFGAEMLASEDESAPVPPPEAMPDWPPAYPGALIDQRRNDLSLQIDDIARTRAQAANDVLTGTDIQAITQKIMLGVASEEDRAAERAFYAAKTLSERIAAFGESMKRSLRDMSGPQLDTFSPDAVDWPA